MISKQILENISSNLNNFDKTDLKQASISLLDSLGYSSRNTIQFDSNDANGFLSFAKQSPYFASFNKENALLALWKKVYFLFQITDDDIRFTNELPIFQTEFKNDLYDSYLFFAIDLGQESLARSKLANIIREVNKLFPMPVLIIFKTGETISISIINRRCNKLDHDKHVLEKVTTIKDINFVQPHRAHLEILAEMSLPGLIESGYEVKGFLSLHKAWSYVLNTEELNKQFYNNIKEWFYRSKQEISFSPESHNKDEDKTEFLIRLLTRMIFIWFIKEKQLVDDRLFDLEFLKVNVFNPDCHEHSIYYKAILQNLFFATLNNEMNKDNPEFKRQFMPEKRNFTPGYLNQYYYRYSRMFKYTNKAIELFELTPYLNGGLFECLDNPQTKERKDYFTNPPENKDLLTVPDDLFFSEDSKGNPKGLINIFKHYKFTVTENTPIDEEIALDPELLGKVFESLLSEWDTEFNETKKKHTGSYYTPRDIVDYMVTNALVSYLDNYAVERNLKIGDRIQKLFEYSSEIPGFTTEEQKILIEGISNVKILDPACGSGAFLMGMLHKIVYVLSKLDPLNNLFKAEQKAIAEKALNEDIEKANQINDIEARNKAEEILIRKMERLEEAFSDKTALDYARKLYIIENCIYGSDIQPIAIQIAKLRFFVSLIIEQEKNLNKKNYGLIPLPNFETKLIAADTLIPLMRQIKNESYYRQIEQLELQLKEVRKKYFFSKDNKEKRSLREEDKKLRNNIETIVGSYYSEGQIPEEIKIMLDWNPYDSSKYAEFFDPFWMFSLNNAADEDMLDKQDKEPSYNKVFDIIIGNPPYVRADNQAIRNEREKIKATKYYETLWEKWDLYIPFLERSYKLLKTKGLFSFIISDAYMSAKYAKLSQEYFITNSTINRIDFLSELRIFDAAVKNIILQIQTSKNPQNIPLRLVHKGEFGNFTQLEKKTQEELGVNVFKPYSTTAIIPNINAMSWGEICYVSVGMVLNAHEEICKGSFTKDDLISDTWDEIHSKEYLEAKWIEKYHCVTTKYLEWNTNRVPKSIRRPTFPELYKHPKIMLGGMTGAIYDDSQLVCNHSIIVSVLWKDLKGVRNKSITMSIKKDFKPNEKIDSFRKKLEKNSELFELKYLLSILNSSYAKYFLKTVQRSQIGVYPDDIKKIPIPIIDKEQQTPYCTLVDYIMFLKNNNDSINKDFENEFIADEFDKLLDALVIELYFQDEVKKSGLEFYKLVQNDFQKLVDNMDSNTKSMIINNTYLKFRERDNSLRNNLILMNIRLHDIMQLIRGSI